MAYFTLAVRNRDGDWQPEFGDYDRDTVEFERREYRMSGHARCNVRIIRTKDAKQATINAAIDLENKVAAFGETNFSRAQLIAGLTVLA